MISPHGAGTWVWVHYTMAATWLGLVIPTLLWWRDSILWVAFMSLYANIVGHIASAQAARAEVNGDNHATKPDA